MQGKIPNNLEECFEELKNNILTEKEIKLFSSLVEENVSSWHHSLGMDIRNNWGLWTNSSLAKYFEGLGIMHADDMSGIILTSFHRYLHRQPIELEKQIKEYQDYWTKAAGLVVSGSLRGHKIMKSK